MTTSDRTTQQSYSDGSELIPAEVAAQEERQGKPMAEIKGDRLESSDHVTTDGYTVDREGLVNNYAVTPETHEATYPTPRQQLRYLLWGGLAIALVTGLIGLSLMVS